MSDTLTPRTDAACVAARNGPFAGEPETQAWQLARDLECELAAAKLENNQLRAQLDEAIGDKERLDWLEATRSEIDTDGPGFVVYSENDNLGYGASKGAHKTLRQAIDKARSATP